MQKMWTKAWLNSHYSALQPEDPDPLKKKGQYFMSVFNRETSESDASVAVYAFDEGKNCPAPVVQIVHEPGSDNVAYKGGIQDHGLFMAKSSGSPKTSPHSLPVLTENPLTGRANLEKSSIFS